MDPARPPVGIMGKAIVAGPPALSHQTSGADRIAMRQRLHVAEGEDQSRGEQPPNRATAISIHHRIRLFGR